MPWLNPLNFCVHQGWLSPCVSVHEEGQGMLAETSGFISSWYREKIDHPLSSADHVSNFKFPYNWVLPNVCHHWYLIIMPAASTCLWHLWIWIWSFYTWYNVYITIPKFKPQIMFQWTHTWTSHLGNTIAKDVSPLVRCLLFHGLSHKELVYALYEGHVVHVDAIIRHKLGLQQLQKNTTSNN